MFFWIRTSKSLIVLFCTFIVLPLRYVQGDIYLFNTEDNDAVEYYDCIILEPIPYCRRPGFPINLRRNNDASNCHHQGKRIPFEELRRRNRTPNEIIHEFRSSIEKAEEYALFLSGHMNSSSLCDCPKRSFGKNCEYQILGAGTQTVTFEQSQKWQSEQKQKNQLQMHAIQKTLCYTTLKCDYGLLCLDWRDICDGRQQCMDGIDEEACDLLEFNECEDDEYRCSNGMCIPDIYFLDGEYDCMDYSDEQRSFDHSICGYQLDALNCDEHVCAVGEWSCGDGQCIAEKNRYEWQENTATAKSQCHSMREYLFMCELSVRHKLWTSVNGTCEQSTDFNEIDEKWNKQNQTTDEYCQYLVKCALSDGLKQNCSCGKLNCSQQIVQKCPTPIPYPSKGLLTPYLIAYYNNTRKSFWGKYPDFYMMAGSIRCRGYSAQTHVNKSIRLLNTTDKRHMAIVSRFCEHPETLKDVNGPQFHSLCYANISRTLERGLSYAFYNVCKQCISQYRINDGIRNCFQGEDERPQQETTCTDRVRRHRFRCSSEQDTCLVVKTLGDSVLHCTQKNDEFESGTGRSLSGVVCGRFEDDGCRFLLDYILLSRNNFSSSREIITKAQMPFRFYCDTFWNLPDNSDESWKTCRDWICGQDEYQCRSGQCVPRNYVCDGEWDCADASDELFHSKNLTDHNKLINLAQKLTSCAIDRRVKPELFDDICNVSLEYPCLLVNVTRQSDTFSTHRCIKISQIGDNTIDCLGGLDERNTLTHCRGVGPLGFAFQCRSTPNVCIEAENLCTSRCSDRKDDRPLCGDRDKDCSDPLDVLCANGTCVKNARCNGQIQCEYGEDEFWCNTDPVRNDSTQYRLSKRLAQLNRNKYLVLPRYPPNSSLRLTAVIEEQKNVVKRSTFVDSDPSIASFKCNRGVAVWHYTNTTICFCPPSYYGQYCEYHSDRLTSHVHLNASDSSYVQTATDHNITIKVLVLLMHGNRIIYNLQFHVGFAINFHVIIKKNYHLIYSREAKLLNETIRRKLNRTLIVDHHLYHVRYEAYELKANTSIRLVGVWQYPIFFDFLPSFRLSKILHFHEKLSNSPFSPCQPNPCNFPNAKCHILQNDPEKYVCLCDPNYSGERCSIRDQHCANNFCHSNSLCKPMNMGSTADSRLPFCVCPLNVYGTRCGLVLDQCWSNPCKNSGTCYPSTSDLRKIYCACNKNYYGSLCEIQKEAIDLIIHGNNVSEVSVIQYFYIDRRTLNLIFEYQELFTQYSNRLHYQYAKTFAPNIVLLKRYSTDGTKLLKIFLLSLTINEKKVNSSTALAENNSCFNLEDMMPSIPVHQYHTICRNSSSLLPPLCFFDAQYLCFCETDNYRAECFGYDHKIAKCGECYNGGRCIQASLQQYNDFECICPKCYDGRRCQFDLSAFGFTLDSLLVEFSQPMKIVYTVITFLLVIFGFSNNLFSFVTFKRPTPRKFGIGNLFFIVTCLNPLVLLVLFVKFIQITFTIADIWSCTVFSYLLSVLTRSTYWMTTWITISRLFIILFPTSLALKSRNRAILGSVVTIIILLCMHGHEIKYYATIEHPDTGSSMCVTKFDNHLVSTYNRVTTLIHYLVPFSIQAISITVLIIVTARSRAKTSTKKLTFYQILKKQFQMHKDLYIIPVIIILSALPQTILTFSLGCTELSTIWRHLLLVSYLLSYSPQLLGFIIFVLPSTTYKTEFSKTSLAKKYFKFIFDKKKVDIVVTRCTKMRTNLEGTMYT